MPIAQKTGLFNFQGFSHENFVPQVVQTLPLNPYDYQLVTHEGRAKVWDPEAATWRRLLVDGDIPILVLPAGAQIPEDVPPGTDPYTIIFQRTEE